MIAKDYDVEEIVSETLWGYKRAAETISDLSKEEIDYSVSKVYKIDNKTPKKISVVTPYLKREFRDAIQNSSNTVFSLTLHAGIEDRVELDVLTDKEEISQYSNYSEITDRVTKLLEEYNLLKT